MPNQVSAVDSISPAFTKTKRMLFQPFRFGLWARMAVVSLVTGEIGGGGGGSLGNFNANRSGGNRWFSTLYFFSEAGWEQIQPYFFWIGLGAVAALGLLLLWIYSDCVYRFILLDSVVSGQCRLREGWRRWREAGRRYLLWAVAFGFGALAFLGVIIGVPGLLAFHAGWFEKPDQHLWGLVGGGLLLFFLVMTVVAGLAVIDLFARDFLVPVMAFEEVGALEGWQRLLGIMGAEKGAYALYVLMKIVLSFGSAIIFTIVNLIVILILLIPLAMLGVAGFFLGRTAGVTWDDSTILLVAGLGMLALAAVLYVIGFVYSPGLVFFQSYTLEFFAARYEPLARRLSMPVLPMAPPPPVVPWPPPQPASS